MFKAWQSQSIYETFRLTVEQTHRTLLIKLLHTTTLTDKNCVYSTQIMRLRPSKTERQKDLMHAI